MAYATQSCLKYDQPRPGEATVPGTASQKQKKQRPADLDRLLGFSNNGCDYLEPQNPFPPA